MLREQNSLYGIPEFGVVVNIEKPKQLEEVSIRVDSVRSLLLEKLRELPITILDYETLQESDQYPILHLHINIRKAISDIYPFTAEMKFYQPVKLPLNNNIQTMASTWHNSIIGLVTPDLINYIAARSANLAVSFRIDYQSVN